MTLRANSLFLCAALLLCGCEWGTMTVAEFEVKYGSRQMAKARALEGSADYLLGRSGLQALHQKLSGFSPGPGAQICHLLVYPDYAVVDYSWPDKDRTISYTYRDGDLKSFSTGSKIVFRAGMDLEEIPWDLLADMVAKAPKIPECQGTGVRSLYVEKEARREVHGHLLEKGGMKITVLLEEPGGGAKYVYYDTSGNVLEACK